MHREVFPGIHWIQECGPNRTGIAASVLARGETWYPPGRELHVPQNAYLLAGERTLLFDTLSPAAGTNVLRALDEILEKRGLDYLVISHPDVPHAGNTHRILERYPDAKLVAPRTGDTHELYHLGDARKVGPGDELELGGLTARFHEATFLDAPIAMWMSEPSLQLLFTVDWLGFPHLDGECLRCADEIDAEIGRGRLVEFHSRVLFWYRYVDIAKTVAEIERIARELRPAAIAPAHGLVVREDVPRLLEQMRDVVAEVAEAGRVGVL